MADIAMFIRTTHLLEPKKWPSCEHSNGKSFLVTPCDVGSLNATAGRK